MNEKLDERRKLLTKRLLTARMYILITLILTLVNILSVVIKFQWIRLPFGMELVSFAFEIGFEGGLTRPGRLIVGLLAAAVLFCIYFKAFLSMKNNRKWTTAVCALFTLDLVAVIAFAFISFGYEGENIIYSLILYAVNIALHIYVLVFLFMARRAQYGLEVLPEKEIDDGDPYEEFRRIEPEEYSDRDNDKSK